MGPIQFGDLSSGIPWPASVSVGGCTSAAVPTSCPAATLPGGPLRALEDIPADSWTVIASPDDGYQYKTWLHFCQGAPIAVETLLDSGAATCAMGEQLAIEILNHSMAQGIGPGHRDWPLVAVETWGGAVPGGTCEGATGVAVNSPLRVVGRITLKTRFLGMDGREGEVPVRFKVFKAGDCGWRGAILGAPALESGPRGLGRRACGGSTTWRSWASACHAWSWRPSLVACRRATPTSPEGYPWEPWGTRTGVKSRRMRTRPLMGSSRWDCAATAVRRYGLMRRTSPWGRWRGYGSPESLTRPWDRVPCEWALMTWHRYVP